MVQPHFASVETQKLTFSLIIVCCLLFATIVYLFVCAVRGYLFMECHKSLHFVFARKSQNEREKIG